jgi:hypothetical protein
MLTHVSHANKALELNWIERELMTKGEREMAAGGGVGVS